MGPDPKPRNELLDKLDGLGDAFGAKYKPLAGPIAGVAALGDILLIDKPLPVGKQMALLERPHELVEGGGVEMGAIALPRRLLPKGTALCKALESVPPCLRRRGKLHKQSFDHTLKGGDSVLQAVLDHDAHGGFGGVAIRHRGAHLVERTEGSLDSCDGLLEDLFGGTVAASGTEI